MTRQSTRKKANIFIFKARNWIYAELRKIESLKREDSRQLFFIPLSLSQIFQIPIFIIIDLIGIEIFIFTLPMVIQPTWMSRYVFRLIFTLRLDELPYGYWLSSLNLLPLEIKWMWYLRLCEIFHSVQVCCTYSFKINIDGVCITISSISK